MHYCRQMRLICDMERLSLYCVRAIMNSGLTFLSAVTVGLAVPFLELQPAVATTFSLPLGTSENTFSFTTAPSEELFVGPVVSIDSNGCPGDGCPNSYWNVAVAVDFYSETSG